MVHYTTNTVLRNRLSLLPHILILSDEMATGVCTSDGAQRYVSCLMTSLNAGCLVPSAFSPHEAHVHSAFLGWVLPTIRISELAVLQIVGLDAAVVSQYALRNATVANTIGLFSY